METYRKTLKTSISIPQHDSLYWYLRMIYPEVTLITVLCQYVDIQYNCGSFSSSDEIGRLKGHVVALDPAS